MALGQIFSLLDHLAAAVMACNGMQSMEFLFGEVDVKKDFLHIGDWSREQILATLYLCTWL